MATAHVYESMLGEVRDAAGDSGEFYTQADHPLHGPAGCPKLGEIVLDPACGTGGFLVETLGHLVSQIQTATAPGTAQQRARHTVRRGRGDEHPGQFPGL